MDSKGYRNGNSQDYTIVAKKGEIQKYTLEKSKLYGGAKTIPYQQKLLGINHCIIIYMI